ncbi:unnamed protein product [Mesocestoides corti]|uniref:Uncharacterized protein n=1 Tax=Mesocestoides corti TaxID=53468 RepID=A0A0R3URT5_MESCO|nr:unnamed protein product [Mesocestoides corti]
MIGISTAAPTRRQNWTRQTLVGAQVQAKVNKNPCQKNNRRRRRRHLYFRPSQRQRLLSWAMRTKMPIGASLTSSEMPKPTGIRQTRLPKPAPPTGWVCSSDSPNQLQSLFRRSYSTEIRHHYWSKLVMCDRSSTALRHPDSSAIGNYVHCYDSSRNLCFVVCQVQSAPFDMGFLLSTWECPCLVSAVAVTRLQSGEASIPDAAPSPARLTVVYAIVLAHSQDVGGRVCVCSVTALRRLPPLSSSLP